MRSNPHDSAPATTAATELRKRGHHDAHIATYARRVAGAHNLPFTRHLPYRSRPLMEVVMRGENGYPITPDWTPEPHPVVDISAHVDPPAHEAQPLTWLGDDG